MATIPDREVFPKATCTRQDVENERQLRLDNGAVSSEITEDAANYYLNSVWNAG